MDKIITPETHEKGGVLTETGEQELIGNIRYFRLQKERLDGFYLSEHIAQKYPQLQALWTEMQKCKEMITALVSQL